LFVAGSFFGAPRREFAPAWRPTFFAGAKKVGKETPNTSLFEWWRLHHLNRLRRVVQLVATSIHGDVIDPALFNLNYLVPVASDVDGSNRYENAVARSAA
jgi:hypothetical protein